MADQDDYADSATQGTDQSEGASSAKKVGEDADAIFKKLKRWFKRDYDSKAQVTWRREAREDFAFDAGDQLTEDDKNILKEANRPVVIFNRVGVTCDSVAGQEVANRQEVQFLPRKQGDVKKNELLTSAAQWFRQECDAEDEESDAFRDNVICGMGWTETLVTYDDNPQGDPKIDRTDPLQMVWDSSATKRNLVDKRRVFHIKTMSLDEAKDLCPGDDAHPFEDGDYNASWVEERPAGQDGEPHENDGHFYNKEKNNELGDADDNQVTLVRAQWFEKVACWLTVDPTDPTGNTIKTLSDEEYRDQGAKYKIAGVPMPKCVKSMRKVYRQAYLGNVLLEIGDAPIKDRFSFNAMTGKRDRNKNTFFGIVRAMKDPARWSNKWMSQTMHIMNTSAKGGIMVERGQFFDDDADGEASWAKNDQITYLKPGALAGTNPKFAQKPVSQFPEATFNLMNFAVASLPQVSGVNIETLGMQAQADQAASLDRQRKQSVMIILQPLFDGLRRYRKEQGRCMLFLIQNYLSDGRLIRIEGQENAQYVPLIKDQSGDDYDIIVDESPTSASQKDTTWAMLQQLLPVIGKMLPPATWLALLKYSPLPTSAQADIQQSITQSQQQPNPEQQQREAELNFKQQSAAADIQNHKDLTAAKIAGMNAEAETKRSVAMHGAQTDAMTKALTAPPAIGPDGQPVQNDAGAHAALIMSLMQEMRRDQQETRQTMAALAQAISAPKQLIKDANGEVVGIAPMGQGA